jgi:predicted enzyme related to lactoylglutathione lyase
MVTRDVAWAAGTPCWVDLGVDDVGKAGAFYGGLFGWDLLEGPPEAGGYTMCMKKGRPVAGIGPKQGPPGTPSTWTTYLASEDADETARKITAAGGHVLVAPMDVMDSGRMVVASDPAGAVFGVWQANAHTGMGLANEPGCVVWNENLSRDFEGNKSFYRAVFGYDYGDMSGEGFKYATMKLDGTEVSGIGELDSSLPPEVPAHWAVYFGVEDADAAAERVSAAGGSVTRPPWDSPYGRMAAVADDQGASFLVGSAPAAAGQPG